MKPLYIENYSGPDICINVGDTVYVHDLGQATGAPYIGTVTKKEFVDAPGNQYWRLEVTERDNKHWEREDCCEVR